ncbi:MAG: HupE/UreJ family protein, partial [Bacteroidales bacterium]|nr:HupE/UreJ family protein [Bacteroidales bacterium]
MTEFELYLKLGFQHIIDLQGYDHMLFLLALIASYSLKEMKSVIILITAFTIGHSVSLALSTLHYILVP